MAEAIPEPARDPNPFHHAAALVEKMDRHDVEALGRLVVERLEELQRPPVVVELTARNRTRRDNTARTCGTFK